jgi:sulfatase maturation enzyme AslB (radical SAM superfamily)
MNKKSVHMYPTLRCNGKCFYCSNTVPGVRENHKYQEKLPGHWMKLIRTLEDWELYFTGGEVFLFQGFADIFYNFDKLVRIYTNAMILEESLLKGINPAYSLFRCSYHPNIGSPERFMERMEVLRKKEIPFQVYMVDVNGNESLSMKIDFFRQRMIEIGIDYDQKKHFHKKGSVKCYIPSVFIGPDGTVFNCVSRMLRHKEELGNAFEGYLLKEAEPVICEEPELCSPCDLAAAYQEEF